MKPRFWVALVVILAASAPAGFAQESKEKSAAVDRELLAGVEDKAPVRSASENYAEARAYDYLLVHARDVLPADLRRQARTDLTFVHLFEEPAKYRGQLVTLKGRLRRLLRFDPTPLAAKEGVKNLYEGWLFADGTVANPFCVLASEIGPGLHIGEKLDRAVTFTGFFFKRYRYKAGDGWRDSPLLIGRSIDPIQEAAEPVPSMLGSVFMPVVFGILGLSLALALGLAWYLRQSDRKVRARLEGLRQTSQTERAE